jgi:VanZ family protein
MKNTIIIKNWLPIILWICCIFILSTESFSAEHTSRILEPLLRYYFPHITTAEITIIHYFVRKAAHVIEYCIASMLLFHSFHNSVKHKNIWRLVFYSLVFVFITALADEYHQSFVGERTASITDVGIDLLGGLLGQGISIIFYNLKRRQKS